jgi:glycine C-acetyltransferase
MSDLEEKLKETSSLKHRIIVTDGVFSMDGTIARLDTICDLADKYKALVMTDECHATGFIGKTGRGAIEHRDVLGRVDIITGTWEKPWVEQVEDLRLGKRRLLKCCDKGQDPICSQIL